MPLENELATFERLKVELLKNHKGKFALIHADEFVGSFDTPDAAYQKGVELYGKEPFLVKRIAEQEEVYRNQALSLGLIHARI
jgi:hypothetical protein